MLSSKIQEHQKNEAFYKQRIKELEDEVGRLKTKLDELRKAKNTTVVKREREVLHVESPFRKSLPSIKTTSDSILTDKKLTELKVAHENELRRIKGEFGKESEETDARHRREIQELQEFHTSEMKRRSEVVQKVTESSKCDHIDLINSLQTQLSDLESDNMALQLDGRNLHESIASLTNELSVKEAKWCETEEAILVKVRSSWQEKYKEWFNDMERKVTELQQANSFLQTCLKRTRPNGPDPTSQDPSHSR